MALSGSVTTTSCEGRSVTLKWTATQNVNNNQSTISWSLVGSGSYTAGWIVVSELKVTIDGSQVYYRSSSNHTNCYQGTVLASGTKTLSHNSDGTKSFTIKVEAGIYNWAINCSGSQSFSLNTIPRASSLSLSASSVNVGGTITANISRASSSFTHHVKFFIKDKEKTYYKTYKGVATSQSYTIPTSWYDAMPSSTSCTAHCRIYTYNGNTKIGEALKSFTVNVPSTIAPTVGTITLDPVDINGHNILVQSKNKLNISVAGCKAGTGSSIKSYTFSGPGISSTTTSTSVTSSAISNTETLTYTVKVTDNRGRTASKTKTITCYEYSKPSFSSFKAYRAKDASGTSDPNGKYLYCTYGTKYSSVNGTNNISVKVYYTTGVTTKNATATNGSLAINLNENSNTYNVYMQITDSYGGTTTSSSITVFGSSRVLNITKDGMGFAVGKMSEKTNGNTNGLFECRWDAKFYGTATGPSGFSTSSDKRVKKNIKDIDMNIVDGLRPVQYELSNINDGKTHYGFIAQEVASLLDSAGLDSEASGMVGYIINNGQQEYVLTYTEFVPLLTKKCQDLQSEIDILKQEINSLKNTIK